MTKYKKNNKLLKYSCEKNDEYEIIFTISEYCNLKDLFALHSEWVEF